MAPVASPKRRRPAQPAPRTVNIPAAECTGYGLTAHVDREARADQSTPGCAPTLEVESGPTNQLPRQTSRLTPTPTGRRAPRTERFLGAAQRTPGCQLNRRSPDQR